MEITALADRYRRPMLRYHLHPGSRIDLQNNVNINKIENEATKIRKFLSRSTAKSLREKLFGKRCNEFKLFERAKANFLAVQIQNV